VHPYCIA